MKISQAKYKELLINRFSGNSVQFHSEFERVIKEHGYSEEIKIDFYKSAFKAIMKSYEEWAKKSEVNYTHVEDMYNIFIDALIADKVNTSDIELDLAEFRSRKPTNFLNSDSFVPDTRYYNANTKYGRKKLREQAMRNYQNGSPQYRAEQDNIKAWAMVILIIGVIIFYWLKSKF
ncbi:hypothetical protein [Flavobacterium sp. N2038]|uniref:hypothetical protein n=1 Tax=Flavobacterium sp. N2038 TaxID=2986829 RepID=UPI0022243FF1|nr:hypothetical protein [Flavobacterium sp. N2038]